jgi:hypothetical protein
MQQTGAHRPIEALQQRLSEGTTEMKSTFWRERYMSHPGDQLSDAGLQPSN